MPAERAIGISPGYQKLQLTPGETYEGTISVLNPSTDPDSLVGYFVSVTPFSVSGEKYQTDFISFSDANQIVNWITIDEPSGSVQPGELVEVKYRITVPDNALGGGQYCALVARISDSDFESSGYSISSRSQVASLLYATVSGILKDVEVEDIADYQEELARRLEQDPDGIELMKTIRESGELNKGDMDQLRSVLEGFTKNFIDSRKA